ncbi:MAG TPA: methyl-accepting chemotaxis protein, partial [Marinagarivorans sp.]
ELQESLNGSLVSLAQWVNEKVAASEAAAKKQAQMIVAAFIVMVFVIVTATAMGVYFIYKSIVFPMAHIQSVIRRINRGKLKARVKLIENDELGDLGKAFNQLLDERIQNLEEQSLENERLNNSIISLIRAVGTIARKDLTIKVPVSADITGTVSDAINLLTSETAKTLAQVRIISGEVDKVADVLQVQSSTVARVAEDERKQVIATAKALDTSARAMNDIASKAGEADDLAKGAISSTQQARESVESAVASILGIRETISETEKRIKRLGDRSQEVSGIVSLINTIAERTHILALNASMHAASAGEAGKGFAVVADEVQRLAENAREATADISSMVNNIRVETSDTVNIMNKLIAEVAAGTKTAELAGRRMNDTDKATNDLVALVAVISQSAIRQAEVTSRVRDRAMIIRNFTEKTGNQLGQQKAYTDSLKDQSASLVAQVNLFKLPSELVAEQASAPAAKAS